MSVYAVYRYHLTRIWTALYHLTGTLASMPRGPHYDQLKELSNQLRAIYHFLAEHPYDHISFPAPPSPGSSGGTRGSPGSTNPDGCPGCRSDY